MTEFIPETPDDFIEITTKLANDIDKLTGIRKGLRNKINHSTLTNT